MSAITSSAINKGGAKVAPRAAVRRRPGPARSTGPSTPAAAAPPDATNGDANPELSSSEVRDTDANPQPVVVTPSDPPVESRSDDSAPMQPSHAANVTTVPSDAAQDGQDEVPDAERQVEADAGSDRPEAAPTASRKRKAPTPSARSTKRANAAQDVTPRDASHSEQAASAEPSSQSHVEVTESTVQPQDSIMAATSEGTIVVGTNNVQGDAQTSGRAEIIVSAVGAIGGNAGGGMHVVGEPTPSGPGPKPRAGVKRKRAAPLLSEAQSAAIDDAQRTTPVGTDRATEEPQAEVGAAQGTEVATTSQTETRPGAKGGARKPRKSKAAAASQEQGVVASVETDPTATKKRQPRKRKQPPVNAGGEANAAGAAEASTGDHGHGTETVADSAPKKRKERRKRNAATITDNQAVEGGEQQSIEANEDDEIDPELHEIDPNAVTMAEIVRDRGVGKTSERERKMAEIDWTEVSRKRREEGSTSGKINENDGGDKASAENDGDNQTDTPGQAQAQTQTQGSGMRLRLVNGEMVIDEESQLINREEEAARNAEGLAIEEENDLTRRVNRMTWINDKRRDPAERLTVYKMKSDPWSDEETDRFYEALRMFGTDFFIISKMFPPKTRRQIKLKFIREERMDRERINRAVAGETMPGVLETFAEAIGKDIESFKDPRAIEEELRLESQEKRVEIELKKKETAEAQKQREIQMAAREKERAEREVQKQAQKEERAAIRARKRAGQYGTGTF